MSDCKNPNCEEKNLHPVTVRSHEGCCGPLCEEVMDHEKTLIENEKLKARVEELKQKVSSQRLAWIADKEVYREIVEELESKLKAEREIAQANADDFHDADKLVEELEGRLDYVDFGWREGQGFKSCHRCTERDATYYERRNGNLCGQCRSYMLNSLPDHFEKSDFLKIREQTKAEGGNDED